MASLEGVSLEFTARKGVSRTLLSSVGGFSQPNRRQIRSLQQLLGTIRLLGLEFTPGHSLQEQNFCGEGVSYKVFKCRQRQSGKVVAVKQIKLPSLATPEAFERQVACVLRDIEVMSYGPLARHPNVLDLVGYGWGLKGSGSIPFLVTEYATDGTLRDYLRKHKLPSRDKLLMCINVARGLHELHLCGLAHGDLKLDNVLVATSVSAQDDSQTVVAKISDFGHSLMLYEDGDAKEDQRYGGTLAYNAPEILKDRGSNWDSVNLRKCDVWALGLLCWEALDNGLAFYKTPRIQELIAFTKTSSKSTSINTNSAGKGSHTGSGSTTESVLEGLTLIADKLYDTSLEFLESDTVKDLYSFEKIKLKALFAATLDVDPEKRVADIPMLPILSKSKTKENRTRLGQQNNKSAEWSFEVFRPAQMSSIPYTVKTQIFNDCCRIGSEAGRSVASAQAAFHVSLAHFIGFGTEVDSKKGTEWVSKSSSKGFPIASLFSELIGDCFIDDSTSTIGESHIRYTDTLRNAFRKLDVPYLDIIPSKTQLTYTELKAIATDHERESRESDEFSDVTLPFYLAHYAVVHELTGSLQEMDEINIQEQTTGETPLYLACRFGDIMAVKNLMARGADPYIAAIDGSLPIHWLWMFPTDSLNLAAELLFLPSGSLWADLDMEGGKTMDNSKPRSPRRGVNTSSTSPRYLHPQLPLYLIGTPLAFAVTVASKPAVELFLKLGADPLVGPDPQPEEIRLRNPIAMAASLHLREILELLRLNLTKENHSAFKLDVIFLQESAWKGLVESSPIERTLIHGRHRLDAARDIVEYFLRDQAMVIPSRLAAAAIEVSDLAIANLSLEPENLAGSSPFLVRSEKDDIMLVCTRAACSGALESQKCISLLEFAVSKGSVVNCDLGGNDGLRAVNIAIEYHREDILNWFLDKGVDVNSPDQNGCYPLHFTIRSGFSATYSITKLLNAGADPNLSESETGETALHVAVKTEKLEETETLLKFGADPSIQCNANIYPALASALHYAVDTSDAEIVAAILKHQQSSGRPMETILELKNGEEHTPLALATLKGKAEIVKLLVEAGSDTHTVDSDGFNCLHIAAKLRYEETLKVLLQKMDVDSFTILQRQTALGIVLGSLAEPRSSACAILLLDAGADPLVPNAHGIMPLSSLGLSLPDKRGREIRKPILDKFVEKGINLDSLPPEESPLLHRAILNQDIDLAEDLLNAGASVSTIDFRRRTPLRECASVYYPDRSPKHLDILLEGICKIAKLLIEAGADIRYRDHDGFTPLQVAAMSGSSPMVNLLLQEHKKQSAAKIEEERERLSAVSSISKRRLIGHSLEKLLRVKSVRHKKGRKINMTDERLKDLSAIDQEIVLVAWSKAIYAHKWASVCAFLTSNCHGDIDLLMWPMNLGMRLLRYGLDHNVEIALLLFMDIAQTESRSQHPEPELRSIWSKFCTDQEIHNRSKPLVNSSILIDLPSLRRGNYYEAQTTSMIETLPIYWTQKVREIPWGPTPEHLRPLYRDIIFQTNDIQDEKDDSSTTGKFLHPLAGRVSQLIQAGGFTPMLSFASLCEKEYVESQVEYWKEVRPTEGEVEPPPIFDSVLFDDDDDDALVDPEVQTMLNSLLGSMRDMAISRSAMNDRYKIEPTFRKGTPYKWGIGASPANMN